MRTWMGGRGRRGEEAYLEQVGEVDKHVVPRLLLAACDVEADGDDVHALPTLGKLVLDGEGIQPCCG